METLRKTLGSADWWAAAGIRALRTGAQALVTLIGTGAVGITQLDWPQMGAVVATTRVLSLATSLAGLPEVGGGADGTD